MKIIDYTVECTKENRMPEYFSCNYNVNHLLFFDIETTGFLAQNTTLYLIGVLWKNENTYQIRQWFNEDGKSENELINAFIDFCKNYTHLVHFNGLGFDLPYLKQKANSLSLSFPLAENLSQIDIYKEIRPFKNVFGLENMKQVSIEQYLNIKRTDTYSGKELIQIYQRYVAKPTTETEQLLLLHNHDDLLGMLPVSHILHYKQFFELSEMKTVEYTITEEQLELHFTFDSSASLPRRLSVTKNGIYLNAIDTVGTLYIPITNDTLKHYLSDYKNYYYLPLEDTAIHKSIATYVDSEHKVKANKKNCYLRKESRFIPCYAQEGIDIFHIDIQDKQIYQTLDSFTTSSFEKQCFYTKNTLRTFL